MGRRIHQRKPGELIAWQSLPGEDVAHPVGTVYAGPIFWEATHAKAVMSACRDFLPTAAEELGAFVGLKTVPSMDPFPKNYWGRRACAVISSYNGSPAEREKIMARLLKSVPPPIFNWMGAMPFPAMQSRGSGCRYLALGAFVNNGFSWSGSPFPKFKWIWPFGEPFRSYAVTKSSIDFFGRHDEIAGNTMFPKSGANTWPPCASVTRRHEGSWQANGL